MTPATEKATPIPAEVRRQVKKLWGEHGGFQYGPRVEHYAITEDAFWQFMAAILADHEARPSLPDSREGWTGRIHTTGEPATDRKPKVPTR